MAKIFRISGYLVDANGVSCKNDIKAAISQGLDLHSQQLHIESAEITDWTDEHPLNSFNCDLAYCAEYFKTVPSNTQFDRPIPKAGELYRHFKIGKVVKVIAVSRHTETEEVSVVYECNEQIWNRPLDMFMSEVDRKKYPDVTQKYRFEKVEK